MSDASQREWRFYLDDMIDFAGKVLAYTDGLDQAGLVASGLTYDATLRNLELIGEAATHIPDEVRAAHPEIPWRMIIAIGHLLLIGRGAAPCLPASGRPGPGSRPGRPC